MLPYIGGKCALSKWIISNFPENYQKMQYVEVFGGGGWVLFKKERSFLETYNDKDENLVNLFRTIRNNYEEFKFLSEWTLLSRSEFNLAKEKLTKGDTAKIERALCYAVKQMQCFSGKGGWGFQVKANKPVSLKWTPFLKRISQINERFRNVQIECLDYKELIEKYDHPNTLFYCDPPYLGKELYYSIRFNREDHIRLAGLLKAIKGKFALSYYDHPFIRELYKDYNIKEKTSRKNSVGITRQLKTKDRPRTFELLITNY